MSSGLIVLIFIVALILIVGYVVAVILRKRNEALLAALEERKEKLYNLPVNDEVEAVKNMHLIGQSQVAFREWNQKWVDLSLNSFADIENNLFEAEGYNNSFRFMKAKQAIDNIESQIQLIDEDIKAVDGSRVRLRLLDDVEINECVVRRGTYLYATVSGFSSGRVKGKIGSLLINDELVKVSLSLYDTDGMEGLYVPNSQFRETSKDVASGAVSGNMSMNTGGYGNSLAQWGMQAVNNAYQKTSSAIGKAIKKNKVKLKYGTFVYLVNGSEKQ